MSLQNFQNAKIIFFKISITKNKFWGTVKKALFFA